MTVTRCLRTATSVICRVFDAGVRTIGLLVLTGLGVVAQGLAKGNGSSTYVMKKIPVTENALVIRTDFSDQAAWERLLAIMREPEEPFIFVMEVLEDRNNDGATVEQLMAALPENYPHNFMTVVDNVAISEPDHPVLVVDLGHEPGCQFRAVAAEVPSIDNNLSISNMGFEEFAQLVDESGVFRGVDNEM